MCFRLQKVLRERGGYLLLLEDDDRKGVYKRAGVLFSDEWAGQGLKDVFDEDSDEMRFKIE